MSHRRTMVEIIKEICQEHHIQFHSFSDDWILELSVPGDKTSASRSWPMLVYGNYFPVNGEATGRICSDKAALSDLLASLEIPHVPHTYFPSPMNEKLAQPAGGIWPAMLKMLTQYGRLVVKNNTGTGGLDVFCVSTQTELEKAVSVIFSHGENVSISPWVDIQNEYRAIIVGKDVALLYRKVRPHLTGDGIHTIQYLMDRYAPDGSSVAPDRASVLADNIAPDHIPGPGEPVYLSWKHNLGQGAHAEVIYVNENIISPQWYAASAARSKSSSSDTSSDTSPDSTPAVSILLSLALACAKKLDLQFASIDILELHGITETSDVVETSDIAETSDIMETSDIAKTSDIVENPDIAKTSSVQYKILEINSGVMMDNFAAESPENYQMAKCIYEKVILDYLSWNGGLSIS